MDSRLGAGTRLPPAERGPLAYVFGLRDVRVLNKAAEAAVFSEPPSPMPALMSVFAGWPRWNSIG